MASNTSEQKIKVLLIVQQCYPDSVSVFLVGYQFFKIINDIADVTLVTHEQNRESLEKRNEYKNVIYMKQSKVSKKYNDWLENLAYQGKITWALYHVFAYPVYAEFDQNVYETFKSEIVRGDYDIVHAITPIVPRYPYKVSQLFTHTPFILGPVNGGVPFPAGFKEVAEKEGSKLNSFLKALGRRIIPGYVSTYKKAAHILSGSTYTSELIKKLFNIPNQKITLVYENAIESSLLENNQNYQKYSDSNDGSINLLFVGRLVPYKCADIVIEAINRLAPEIKDRVYLTIVGDGSEKNTLQKMVGDYHLDRRVKFTGWLSREEVLEFYQEADIFCFPSIREFGGAVVIEAMTFGLPCIVVNNGGIGEYVTEKVGFSIDPVSREHVVDEVKNKIEFLVLDRETRNEMSQNAIRRAGELTWDSKAKTILEIYEKVLRKKAS